LHRHSPPPPRPLARLALLAAVLAAPAVHADQCTVADITMTKIYPTGGANLTRGNNALTNNVIIQFSLPTTCSIADPPLTACVDVWDTGNPGEIPKGFRAWGGWKKGFPPRLCNAGFLIDNGQGTNTAVTAATLAIDFVGTQAGPHPPDRLILVMHNPTRYLKIPIDP